jgi:hypothetical protein
MKNLIYTLSSLVFCLIIFSSCEKEHSEPILTNVPQGSVKTIAEVRAMEVLGTEVIISDDISVYGVVTMDETTGNLYKEAYMTDATGNLYLRFTSGSGLYIGDSIMVNLNGAKILRYNQMLQIDSLHPDNSIVKISTQNFKAPEVTTIAALLNNLEASQGKLVQLDNSWFQAGGQGLTYANAATQTSESRFLQDIVSDIIEVRTSGYSNFANDTLPSGAGSFVGVVAQYNSGIQLLIRNPNELSLNGTLPQFVIKNFDDQNINSGGWTIQEPTPAVTPTLTWATSTQGGNPTPYGVMLNWNGSSNEVVESWLISPGIDLSSSTNSSLSFSSDFRYTGPTLEVLISTDYDGVSLPATANWTPIVATLDTDGNNWGFVNSGQISLNPYLGNNSVYIAYKYTGTISDGSTWELEDIQIIY